MTPRGPLRSRSTGGVLTPDARPSGEAERAQRRAGRGAARGARARRPRRRRPRRRAARRGEGLLRRRRPRRTAGVGRADPGGERGRRRCGWARCSPGCGRCRSRSSRWCRDGRLPAAQGWRPHATWSWRAQAPQFGYPEIQRGFVPAMVMTLLRRAVGEKVALDLVLTGGCSSAEEARAAGLVTRVVPDAELDARGRRCCRRSPRPAPRRWRSPSSSSISSTASPR